MPAIVTKSAATRLFLLVLMLLALPVLAVAQGGYWQYVRTDSYIAPYFDTAYPDTHQGVEGNFSVTISEPSLNPAPALGTTFYWGRPPAVLIPGTALYWPVAASVTANVPGRFLGLSFTAEWYPYQPVSDLPHVDPWASSTWATVATDYSMPVGTSVTYNNALQTNPLKVPAGSSVYMDSNGMMTLLSWIRSSSTYYWSYIYQWVPGSMGSCGGTCTLASAGQNMGNSSGSGSVALTATSSWNVVAVDNWITVTSPTSGTGNSTVTFTVTANTGAARTGTLIVGGKPYTISQDGATSASTGGPGPGTTNVALNKPVTVSSKYPTYKGAASAITSDPFNTAWWAYQGAPNYCSLVVDLGQSYSLGIIELEPMQTFDYQLYGSTDGTNYTQIASQTWPVWVGMPISIAVSGASSARYLKYEAHTPWNQYIGLAGIRVYEWLANAPTQPASAYGTTNLAKGKPVQNVTGYTSDSAHPPASVVDGSNSTYWTGTNSFYTKSVSTYDFTGTSAAVTVDLGQSVKIGKIVVNAAKVQGFSVSLSADGTAMANYMFSNDPSLAATAATAAPTKTFYVDGRTTARYVTLTAWNLTPGAATVYPSINEIEVYDFAGQPSTCSGTCTLAAPGQPAPATGGPVTVSVTTVPASTVWTVVPVDTWIQVTSPATNTGPGTVSITVSPNTGAPRVGVASIAGIPFTISQNGVATGTTAGCNYLIQSNTTQTAPLEGTTSGFIQIITAQGCAWTATTAASWITINSGAASSGNGAVSYSVAANSAAAGRSGSIVIAGQNVVVNQPGTGSSGTGPGSTPAPGTPVVNAGGVVNTANYAPGGPPSGSLAQGSYFSIYGSSLGPEQWVKASTYPLPKTLGGTSIQIASGGVTYDALMVFTSQGQINAILPSKVPVGTALVVVTYNGKTSSPATISVTKTNVGVFYQDMGGQNFAIAQNFVSATSIPLNLPTVPAKPGQIVIFWATGMGAISASDDGAPGAGDMVNVPVAITVGGVTAPRLYAGRQSETAAVDNIYFTVPNGTTLGCYVPVTITAGGLPANTTMIAITADGSPCK